MAHELLLDDHGSACMMYVKTPPWHELGIRLDKPPTAAEAICHARLDWSVSKRRILTDIGSAQTCFVPGLSALVPDEGYPKQDRPVFGIVTDRYRVLQNRDAFAFFDPLVKAGHAAYETAGALGEGERIWVLVRMAGAIDVGRGDRIAKYLLLANSHDGHGAVQIQMTPIRVVCQNTLSRALRGGGAIHVSHAGNLQNRLHAAQRVLAWQEAVYADLAERYRAMAATPMDNEALTQYYRAVFPAPPAPKTPGQKRDRLAARRRAERARRCCARLFERESDTLRFGAAGTLWTAYNSVTEYVDHVAPSRVNDPMRRLQSMWFGKGSALKALAYRRAMHWLRRSGTGAALP